MEDRGTADGQVSAQHRVTAQHEVTRQDPAAEEDLASVRAFMRGWSDEVAAADLTAGRRRFDPALVAFGTHADVVRGRQAVEDAQWSRIWPAIEDFRFHVEDLDAFVSPDRLQAVAVCTFGSTGIADDGTRFDRPGRATVVLRRDAVDASWTGVHTHLSLGRGVPQSTHGRRVAR